MKPIYDHFHVVKAQEDLDNEKKRLQEQEENVKKAQESGKRIITDLNTKQKDQKGDPGVVEHWIENEVLTVAKVGKDCEEVKPGDRVIVRLNTMPEISRFKDKFIYSYPERSISILLEEGDE